LKEQGIDFDPTQFPSQVGMIFVPGELSESASVIYKFAKELAKEKKELKILAAYDLKKKAVISAEEFTVIAKLPSREVLLAMVMGAMTGPIRKLMYLLIELGKQPSFAPKAGGSEKMVEAQ
jgi:ribosomal protein L10